MASGLNDRQRLFAREYLIDHNATQAAIRAGYSVASAGSQGHDLLKVPEVADFIATLEARRAAKLDLKAEDVLRELMAIAFADIGEAFDEHHNLKPISDIPEHLRRAMVGLEVEELFDGRGEEREMIGVAKKVKFADKNAALQTLARHLKLLTDKTEHSVDSSFADLLKTARERAQRG